MVQKYVERYHIRRGENSHEWHIRDKLLQCDISTHTSRKQARGAIHAVRLAAMLGQAPQQPQQAA